jgi:type I restriction enzyme S subunit
VTRLKDVAIINRVSLPDTTAPDQVLKYVDIGSVSGLGSFEPEELLFQEAPSRARRLVRSGDTIVSTVRTYLRAVAFIAHEADEFVVSTGFATLTPREGMEPRFLYWLARGSDFIESVVSRSVGVSYPAITATELGSIEVSVPAQSQQQWVAAFLDSETERIDVLIREQEGLIASLLERRASELDRWVEHGGGSELVGVASPWIDAVPESWSFMPLKRCVARVMVGIVINPSAYYEEDGVPVLRGLNIRPGRVSSEDLVYMSDASNELHRKSTLCTGDVVVVRTGAAGSAAVVPDWAVGGNAVDLLIVRPGERLVPAFLEHLLNSRLVQQQVLYGSVGALQSHFNTSALANVMVVVPPVAEQQRVLDHLAPALGRYDELIAEAGRQIALLREHRQALITAAVTADSMDSIGWRDA